MYIFTYNTYLYIIQQEFKKFDAYRVAKRYKLKSVSYFASSYILNIYKYNIARLLNKQQ